MLLMAILALKQLPSAWLRRKIRTVQPADAASVGVGSHEERQGELQRRRATDRLGIITDALPGMVFQMVAKPGADVTFNYVSQGAREIFLLEPDRILREPRLVLNPIFVEDQRRREIAFAESAESGKSVVLEYRFRRRDSSVRWLRSTAIPQPSEDGALIWNGFVQDITEQHEAERRSQALQQHLREVTENAPCTVFQLQRDFEQELSMRLVSENLYALLGITREEVLEDITVLTQRIVTEDLARMLGALDTARDEQRPAFFDIRVRDTANELRWLRGSVSTPRLEDGALFWNGAWLDITDIKTLESELASASIAAATANRIKSEFLATMSHEIRTPMNAIIGMGQLLQQTAMTPHQRGYLDKINTASQSLLGILNDILDLSKIEAGKMSLEHSEFDLNTVFDNLGALTHLKAAEKEIELRFEVPPDLPMRLMGDSLRLGQVLLNLVSNAIKFSVGGQVVVRVCESSREGSRLRLAFEVADQGIGLGAEQIDRLFDSFAQGDASTTRKYGGTGLGLSISRNLVRLMDSDISVESTPGVGSTFRFEAAVSVPLEPQPHYQLPADYQGLSALVADECFETCDAMRSSLAAFGLQVSTETSGLAALQQISTQSVAFAVVILDWRLPQLSGVDLAERIRQLDLSTQPAIIMTSAYFNEQMAAQLEALNILELLVKPFSPLALFKTVLAALGQPPLASNRFDASTALPLASVSAVPDTHAESLLQRSEALQAFDRKAALQRLGGNQGLLDRLVARFVTDHADAARLIIAAIDSGDVLRATREAHTLKGLAANLGASLVAQTAGAIEYKLRECGSVATELLDALSAHQHETLRAMTVCSSGIVSESAEQADLKLLLVRLQQLLQAHDADAKDAFEAIDRAWTGAKPAGLMRLKFAVQSYQFDDALACLRQTLADLHLDLQ